MLVFVLGIVMLVVCSVQVASVLSVGCGVVVG